MEAFKIKILNSKALLITMSLLLLLLFNAGCKKKVIGVPNADLMPAPLDFVVIKNHVSLINSMNSQIALWYQENEKKISISDVTIKQMTHSSVYEFYVTTTFAPLRSSDNIAKEFYFQINNGKVDTIFLDVKRLSEPIDREYNIYEKVKFNNEVILLDKNHKPALWVFKQD